MNALMVFIENVLQMFCSFVSVLSCNNCFLGKIIYSTFFVSIHQWLGTGDKMLRVTLGWFGNWSGGEYSRVWKMNEFHDFNNFAS